MMIIPRSWCICIVLGTMLFLGGCTKKQQQQAPEPVVHTIEASDGQATFAYTKLPEGVSAGDITIRALSEDELSWEGDKTGWRGYDLSPDGIVFDTGAYLLLPYDEGMPFYFHEHDGNITPISHVTYEISDEGKIARVPLAGFSKAIELKPKNPFVTIDLQVGEAEVGDHLPITATVNLLKTVAWGGATITAPSSSMQGTIAANLGVVDLPFVWKIPDWETFDTQYVVDASKELKCTDAGLAQIRYSILLRTPIERVLPFPSEAMNKEDFWFAFEVHRTGECKDTGKYDPPRCGDGKINQAKEQCDTREFGGKTCLDHGFKGGRLDCESCLVSTEYCTKVKELRSMSCSDNSWEDESDFDRQVYICQNDCPEGNYCDTETCTCQPQGHAAQVVTDEELAEEVNQIAKLVGRGEVEKDKEPEEEGEKIEGIFYGAGQYFIPLDQIHPGQGPECEREEHWHANSDEVRAWNGSERVTIKDPFPDGCGFGLTEDRPKVSIPYPYKGLDLSPYKPSFELPGVEQEEEGEPMIQIDPPKTIIKFG